MPLICLFLYPHILRYFKRQCQRRRMELSNRESDYGQIEEQIFDPQDSKQSAIATAITESNQIRSAQTRNIGGTQTEGETGGFSVMLL